MATVTTQGLVFPLVITNGAHTIAEEDDLIKSSLAIILSWPLYTKEYADGFGSRTYEALEDQNDGVLITLIKKFIIDSITTWERRVELKSLAFARPNGETLIVDISYTIKSINIEDTLRYTFYTN